MNNPHFRRLLIGQWLCYLAAGLLGGAAFREYGFDGSVLAPLALAAVVAAIGWLGPQIVHELAEINDQLAGRSTELHSFLSRRPN